MRDAQALHRRPFSAAPCTRVCLRVRTRMCNVFLARNIVAINFAVRYQSLSDRGAREKNSRRPRGRPTVTAVRRHVTQLTHLRRARRRFAKPRGSAIQNTVTAATVITSRRRAITCIICRYKHTRRSAGSQDSLHAYFTYY